MLGYRLSATNVIGFFRINKKNVDFLCWLLVAGGWLGMLVDTIYIRLGMSVEGGCGDGM